MKKFLLTAALTLVLAAPAFAQDVNVEATVTPEGAVVQQPAPVPAPSDDPAAQAAEAAKKACTDETNEKVKLPENAGEAEKAQWDAAFAECVKGKGVEPTANVDVNVEVTPAVPAPDAEAASDAAQ